MTPDLTLALEARLHALTADPLSQSTVERTRESLTQALDAYVRLRVVQALELERDRIEAHVLARVNERLRHGLGGL